MEDPHWCLCLVPDVDRGCLKTTLMGTISGCCCCRRIGSYHGEAGQEFAVVVYFSMSVGICVFWCPENCLWSRVLCGKCVAYNLGASSPTLLVLFPITNGMPLMSH